MSQLSLSEATHRNIQALNQAQRASLLPIVQQVLHYRDLVARQGWLVGAGSGASTLCRTGFEPSCTKLL
ncbi:hypothetical protein GU260_12025 [Vibrio cholerae]|uniref:hypothetical protein n=1 Tax=Vibrio cholerae TaxID=666 RepID=UPI00155E5728|nr:hypothetical protein [Vibrio cholerae]NOE78852.1 hypothetical protein [Vibrio cholerae]